LFEDDADGDGIKEIYRHYRPPLEAKVTRNDGGDGFGLLVVHTKSKGIFDNTDWIHWQRMSERNRRKLFAECRSIRRRVDEWLDDGRRLVVMGDVNDGPGMDMTESLFGRSAVEILLGEIFEPERLLKSYTGRPRWGAYGWEPSSASFRDSFTHDWVNVLIDHVLISQQIPVHGAAPHKVWNPWQLDEATPIKTALLAASDHFPVTLDLA
jgi:endonuclease/exonuclease/phosphatase family metal-dependent hydrolase